MSSITCPACGSDCNERDELAKAEREITRLRAEVEALRADAERYRWLRHHSTYTTVTPCIHGEVAGPSRMRWYHDSYQLQAFTLDAAIDAARAAQGDKL